jgi:hypothetical protein
MEQERRERINELYDRIRSVEVYKERAEKTVRRLRDSDTHDVEYNRRKVASLRESISNWETELEDAQTEISETKAGLRDGDLRRKKNENIRAQKQRQKEADSRVQSRRDEKKRQKEENDQHWKGMKKMWRGERQQKRDMWHELRRFRRNCDNVPDYMRRNLSDMPNNKGYIWRGIWCLGEKPAEPGRPHVMFERKGKDLLIIHESDEYEIRRYEKKGKNRKVLVHKETRNPKRIGWDLRR